MTVMALRSALRNDPAYYAKIKNNIVSVPTRKTEMTVKELRSKFRSNPRFYARAKNKEVSFSSRSAA